MLHSAPCGVLLSERPDQASQGDVPLSESKIEKGTLDCRLVSLLGKNGQSEPIDDYP